MATKRVFWFGTGLLAAILVGIRLFDLTADPPVRLDWSGGIFFDEGMLAQGARNRILFGNFFQDEWNDFYISPLLSLFKLAVLSVTGVGLFQVRLIPVFFSLLTLAVFYLMFRRAAGRGAALLALALLGCNHVFVMFNRIGLTETPVAFFMLFAGYLWQEGFLRLQAARAEKPGSARPEWWFFAAGVSAFTAYTIKGFPYFIPSLLLASALAWGLPPAEAPSLRRPAMRRAAARALSALLAGIAVPLIFWYLAFYRINAPTIRQAMRYYGSQQIPHSASMAMKNLLELPFFGYFTVTPVELLFSVLFVGAAFFLWFHARGRLLPLDLFFLGWFLAHFVMFAPLRYRPVRYYLPILPPMVALAVRGLLLMGRRTAIRIPDRLPPPALPLLFLWLFVTLFYGLPALLGGAEDLLGRTLLHASNFAVALTATGGALLLLTVAALAVRRWRGLTIRLPARATVALILVLPPVAAFALDAWHYGRWALTRRHVIRDTSRELGRRLDRAFIAGLGAPTLCLENNHRALHVYEGFFNWRDTFLRFPVTHLFLGGFNREADYYYRQYPERMERAAVIGAYPIKENHYYLYSLVEPTVEGVQAVEGGGGAAPLFRITIRNNDRDHLREVSAGGIFLRSGAPGESFPRKAPGLSIRPNGTAEVPLRPDLPPGDYRLLACTFPPLENILEAENLAHRVGRKVRDARASGGEAWAVRAAQFAVFGPYLRYPPGLLQVSFRMQCDGPASPGGVATLMVTTNRGKTILAARDLAGRDFAALGAYEEFTLPPVSLDEPLTLEFPVVTLGATPLTIDRVTVTFTPGKWYPAPVRAAASP